jgi:hypothetical protein
MKFIDENFRTVTNIAEVDWLRVKSELPWMDYESREIGI